MINFIIPGFYENFVINKQLLILMKDYPHFFRDDIQISAIYGVFPFNIFDGGRIFRQYRQATIEEIEQIRYIFNDQFNIPIRQVCTNPVVEPKNYKNHFANLCLSICENEKNEIITNNDGLKEYIKNRYPKYTFISSTTKCLNKVEDFKHELNNPDYKMICLDYNLNHNWKMLEALTPEEKNKCEFLCNAICPPGCPERKLHYKFNGLFHLGYGEDYRMCQCGVSNVTISKEVRDYHNNITPDELYNKYAPMGFKYFKLEGRTLPHLEMALNYAYYMVKPEYQDEVVLSLCKRSDDFDIKMFTQTFF